MLRPHYTPSIATWLPALAENGLEQIRKEREGEEGKKRMREREIKRRQSGR
jgi:hypothetical protein